MWVKSRHGQISFCFITEWEEMTICFTFINCCWQTLASRGSQRLPLILPVRKNWIWVEQNGNFRDFKMRSVWLEWEIISSFGSFFSSMCFLVYISCPNPSLLPPPSLPPASLENCEILTAATQPYRIISDLLENYFFPTNHNISPQINTTLPPARFHRQIHVLLLGLVSKQPRQCLAASFIGSE